MNRVYLRNLQRKVALPLPALRGLVRAAMAELGFGNHSVTVIYCGRRKIRQLNRDFRHKDRPTDVLSFPDGTGDDDGRVYLGEVFIAPEVAAENARDFGAAFEAELRMLHVHGLLHLAGMDHEADRGEMLRRQAALLEKLPTP
ncbi:MAG: rRNA maturation RNase YbeY [Acidobacteria bacterium]|nr:rRNA maturation RNase YbeY [Acidobacteriota bacterium]